MRQEQFLSVVSRDEAERRFRGACDFSTLPAEEVPLAGALGRVLAADVGAPLDVPGFVRSLVDGYAVRAQDTFGAAEEQPRMLRLNPESIATGVAPRIEVQPGTATPIATGGVVPRGADCVVMVEDTDAAESEVAVRRPAAPGARIAQPGSDIGRGETVLRAGDVLSSRETGLLAALGIAAVPVVRRPRVAVFSTGDEVAAPGGPLPPGGVYDANGRILADAVQECGGEAQERGIVGDDEAALRAALAAALAAADLVLLSGGTSKGAGDLSYRVVGEAGTILVHGVALKPGKPIVLAKVGETPVVILPGFPTSAIFTFHEFVAPWIRARAGLPPGGRSAVRARLPRAVNSQRGRTEYDLVHLVPGPEGLAAYSLGKGSGSLTTFARADGFQVIPAGVERREAGEAVDVTLIGPLRAIDLTVIGSQCTGLDLLLSLLRRKGFTSKVIAVGSTGGLSAARRGECDLAPVHLFDEKTGRYNEPFVEAGLLLVRGYGRRQGIVSRDGKAEGRMINRNRGSGTRALIDRFLGDRRPEGYELEVRSHRAVAAAVVSGRADWGICIENVAEGLEFEFLAEERFDFLVPEGRIEREPVKAFVALLESKEARDALAAMGFVA